MKAEINKELLDIVRKIFQELDGPFDYVTIDNKMYKRLESVIKKAEKEA